MAKLHTTSIMTIAFPRTISHRLVQKPMIYKTSMPHNEMGNVDHLLLLVVVFTDTLALARTLLL